MSLNPFYIVASDLESYFVDKDTGLPLANGTLSFYRDSARNVPKIVKQLTGAPPYSDDSYISMGYQITLSAVGTVQNAAGDNEVIYWYPYDADGNLDLYYVVVANSAGTVQFTREAWPNGAGGGSAAAGGSQTNQISNPTFTNVFLNPGIDNVYNVASVSPEIFALGPDWYFEIAGTGTVTVQQIAIAGNQNVITNPPYVLDINVSAGITTCKLAQKFATNSGLWSTAGDQTIYLYGAFVAQNVDSGTAPVIMAYEDGTDTVVEIVNANVEGAYTLQNGTTAAPIPASSNSSSGTAGFVTIYFSFSPETHVQLSAIQLIPLFSQFTGVLPTIVDSSNRNEAYQGDYYIPRVAAKQIESFLSGWDFPLNPYQFGASGNITNTAAYIIDQTIASAATSNVAWAADPVSGGIKFTTTGTNDSFYLLQYLSGDNVKNIISSNLSSNVFGYQSDSLASNNIKTQIRLFRAPSNGSPPTPIIPILPLTIGTIVSSGVFTLTAPAITNGWTEIPRSGLPTATATLSKIVTNSDINNGENDYGFSEWQLTDVAQIGNTDFFAIVVIFTYALPSTIFTINSISLTPGDLPCRPAVKSVAATLRECEYYYEKSWVGATFTNAAAGELSGLLEPCHLYYPSNVQVDIYSPPLEIFFSATKRLVPTMTFYSVTDNATAGQVTRVEFDLAAFPPTSTNLPISHWTISNKSTVYYLLMVPNNLDHVNSSTSPDIQYITCFQYIADARLGKV